MEEKKPVLITVITCFYNEAAFLSEAVHSVLNQEYTNWELLLVDDGSTDDSVKIAKQFAAGFPEKIFYFDHPAHQNRGLSCSRNLGIHHSKGEFLCFLDADDVYRPKKIKRQLEILNQQTEADMICEATQYWYSWNDPSHPDPVIPIGKLPNYLYDPPALLLALYPLGEGEAPCTSSFLVRKKAVDKVGGFEESFSGPRQLYEDQGFFSKMYLMSKIYISDECHSLYRQRQESLVYSIKRDGHYTEVRKFYLLWLQNFLEKNHCTFPELTRTLKQVMIREGHSGKINFISFLKKIAGKIYTFSR